MAVKTKEKKSRSKSVTSKKVSNGRVTKQKRDYQSPTFNWEEVDNGTELVLVDSNKDSFKEFLKSNNLEEAYVKTRKAIKHYNNEALGSGTEYLNKREEREGIDMLTIKTSDDEYNVSLNYDVSWKNGKAYSDEVHISSTNPFEVELDKYSPVWSIVWEE